MAERHIRFTGDGEFPDDRNSEDAVNKIKAGDPLDEEHLNQGGENLRLRTEGLRTPVEDLLYRMDVDNWIISGGDASGTGVGSDPAPKVHWPDSYDGGAEAGTISISDPIVIQPVGTPRIDLLETKTYTFDDGSNQASLTFGSKMRAYQGGNLLEIRWEEDDSLSAVEVTVLGDPQHIVRIKFPTTGSLYIDHIRQALQASSEFLALWTLSTGGSPGVTVLNATTSPGTTEFRFTKNLDRELHRLSPATLAAFFADSADNWMKDGDTIGIYYPYLTDPDAFLQDDTGHIGGRRQACVINSNVELAESQLVNLTREPEKAPLCTPLCKRIGDYVYFIDGTVTYDLGYTGDTGVSFGDTAFWKKDLYSSGSELVRMASSTGAGVSQTLWDITADSVQTTLETLQGIVNDKGDLTANESVSGEWDFSGGAEFSASFYYTSTSGARLLSRTGRVADSGVKWGTVSTYYVVNGSGVDEYEVYATVLGGYLSISGDDISCTAAPDETVNGTCVIQLWCSNKDDTGILGVKPYSATYVKHNVAPGTVFTSIAEGTHLGVRYFAESATFSSTLEAVFNQVGIRTTEHLQVDGESIFFGRARFNGDVECQDPVTLKSSAVLKLTADSAVEPTTPRASTDPPDTTRPRFAKIVKPIVPGGALDGLPGVPTVHQGVSMDTHTVVTPWGETMITFNVEWNEALDVWEAVNQTVQAWALSVGSIGITQYYKSAFEIAALHSLPGAPPARWEHDLPQQAVTGYDPANGWSSVQTVGAVGSGLNSLQEGGVHGFGSIKQKCRVCFYNPTASAADVVASVTWPTRMVSTVLTPQIDYEFVAQGPGPTPDLSTTFPTVLHVDHEGALLAYGSLPAGMRWYGSVVGFFQNDFAGP